MKNKLKELTDRGYKVMFRTRWSDKAWDVWIYKYNPIEKALDKAITRLEEIE